MGKEIKGTRFDRNGRTVEPVALSVLSVNGCTYLYFQGKKVLKSYAFSTEELKKLINDA